MSKAPHHYCKDSSTGRYAMYVTLEDYNKLVECVRELEDILEEGEGYLRLPSGDLVKPTGDYCYE